MTDSKSKTLELWGGFECTVNRVHDRFFDQLIKTRHAEACAIKDIGLVSKLGIKTLRYPVLWERTVSGTLGNYDWRWPDARLSKLKEFDIKPVIGLLHHGSGPLGTDLLDPHFAQLFSLFAKAVAERYPAVEDFTPINEPLTTARFSGLYGVWYPHHKSDVSFVRALLNQIRATVLAMKEIRKVNSKARLIQTEDLGKVTSTELLHYQSLFENRRRWLSFDLLNGHVDTHYPLWDYLIKNGATETELNWFLENKTPPDILGINHYLTSNRFLDERIDRYPKKLHGGNGQHIYADAETVRVHGENSADIRDLLTEAWQRYKLPLVMSECHLDAGREDQMRWLKLNWDSCLKLKDEGVDVRALTMWSLLGAYDWHSLVTREENYYESGAFDLRSPKPRPTALAQMAKSLAKNLNYEHPVLDGRGWWSRPAGKLYPPDMGETIGGLNTDFKKNRPVVLMGGSLHLNAVFSRLCESRDLAHEIIAAEKKAYKSVSIFLTLLQEQKPWAVIDASPNEESIFKLIPQKFYRKLNTVYLNKKIPHGGEGLACFTDGGFLSPQDDEIFLNRVLNLAIDDTQGLYVFEKKQQDIWVTPLEREYFEKKDNWYGGSGLFVGGSGKQASRNG